MSIPALSVKFDYAQQRLSWDRLSVVASGREFDSGIYFADTWIDPITDTLMLRPGPLYAAWETSNSGVYAKPSFSGQTKNDSTKWQSGTMRGAIEYGSTSTANEWIRLASALGKNRAVWLSIFNHSDGGNVTEQCYAGWSDSSSYTDAAGVGLIVYTDGTVDVYRYGVLVGSGKVGANADNKYIDILLVPMRRRELLLVNPQTYEGFTVVFTDIAEDASEPEITPAKKFFAKNPSGTLQVAIAPVNFPTTGYACTKTLSFIDAPTVSDTYETPANAYWVTAAHKARIYGDPSYKTTTVSEPAHAYGDLVDSTAGTWTAGTDGKLCRIKCTITGDGSYTAFVYGAMVAYAPIYATTSAAEIYEAVGDLQSCHLSVPDSGTDSEIDLEFLRLDDLSSHISQVSTQCNRPIQVKLGTMVIMDGRNDAPDWTDDWNAENKHLRMKVRCPWKALDKYRFQDILPLDGYTLEAALSKIVKLALGTSLTVSIDTSGYTLPEVPVEKNGFNVLIEQGDTAGDWVRRLIDDYAATWTIAWMPNTGSMTLVIGPESYLSATPAVTLYPTAALAIADGVSAADANNLLYWNYHEQIVEPEANDVWATGQDPRDRRAIQSHKEDSAARTVTTAPSSRPSNWTGEYSRVGLIAPEMTRQTDTDFAVTTLYDRVTPLVKIADWECNLPFVTGTDAPLWRMHMVRLYGLGTYRILSLDCDFQLETATVVHRQARYVAKRLTTE